MYKNYNMNFFNLFFFLWNICYSHKILPVWYIANQNGLLLVLILLHPNFSSSFFLESKPYIYDKFITKMTNVLSRLVPKVIWLLEVHNTNIPQSPQLFIVHTLPGSESIVWDISFVLFCSNIFLLNDLPLPVSFANINEMLQWVILHLLQCLCSQGGYCLSNTKHCRVT